MRGISQVGPVDILSNGLTTDFPPGLALDLDAQALAESLPLGACLAEISDRCVTPLGKGGLVIGRKRIEVGKQLVHLPIIPKGNGKSIPLRHLPFSNEFRQCGMDIQSHRKLRLRELIDVQCGGVISLFAARIETDESYVSRMLYPVGKPGGKPIADKMMLRIEKAFSLPRAWLDLPAGAVVPNAPYLVDEAHASSISHRDNETLANTSGPYAIATPKSDRWPFDRVTPAQYGSLSKAQRYHVEDTIFVLLGVGQDVPEKSGFPERRVAKAT